MYRNSYGNSYASVSPVPQPVHGRGPRNGSGSTPTTVVSELYPATDDELARTVLVSGLPAGIPDQQVLTVLRLIPGLDKWLRVRRPNDSPADFGFARFSSTGPVKVALAVLPLVSYAIDSESASLEATADQSAKAAIEARAAAVTVESLTRTSSADLVSQAQLILSRWIKAPKDAGPVVTASKDEDTVRDEDVVSFVEKSILDNSEEAFPPGISKDEIEHLKSEIREFREQSLRIIKRREAADEEYKKKTQALVEEKAAQAIQTHAVAQLNAADEGHDDYDRYVESDDGEGDSEADLFAEKKRDATDQDRKQRLFEERERRWLRRERAHIQALDRELNRNLDSEVEVAAARASALRRLTNLANEYESEIKHYEYHYDHASWVKSRISARTYEAKKDADDEREEQEELAKVAPTAATDASSMPAKSGKISIFMGNSSTATAPAAAAPRQPISKLPTSVWVDDDEENATGRKLKPLGLEENRRLEAEIPHDQEALFSWEVKWDMLDGSIMEDIVRPLVVSKVIENLGVEDDDIVEFVISHIQKHNSPEDLVTELTMILDEDAPVFTTQIWRVLVLETERKHRKSSSN